MHRRGLRRNQRVVKGVVLLLGHGAVDVVVLAPPIAGGAEGPVHVHGFQGDDGRGGVVEGEPLLPGEGGDRLREGVAGEGAGGDDGRPLRQGGDLSLHDRAERVAAQGRGHAGAELLPVHGHGAARRHARGLRAVHDERAHAPHLLLEQADRVLEPVRPQGVGADQLRKAGHVVRRGELLRLHLVQRDLAPALEELPCGLAARKARPADVDLHPLPPCFSPCSGRSRPFAS